MDRTTGPATHVYLRGGGSVDPGGRPGGHLPHVHRHLPGDRHPGGQRRLAVHRDAGRRDRAADHPGQRAGADDLGQRHRAHREPVAVRRRRDPHLLLPGRQDRGGRGAGDRHQPGDPQDHAAGDQPAVHRAVQRHQRADRADRRQQRHADRAADLRLRRQLHHPAARHRAGARVPQPWGGKWPQVMVDLDLDATVCPRPVAAGRPGGHQHPEPDHPGRHRQDRATRNITSSSTAAPTWSPRSTTSRSSRSTACRSTSRTWPTCAWATWCRPTSSAATAAAPC